MNEEVTVPDLYRLAFIPGCFRCPKCNCQLTKSCWNPESGEIGTRPEERESEPCPNDGTMMVHVTYREQMEAYADRIKEEIDRFDAHTKAVADFLNELWAIMVDPLADGVRRVSETMEGLKNAALGARQLGYQKHDLGDVRRNMNVEQIARICHETNKAYCESIGDRSQKSWDDAEEWQRQSAIKGVQFALDTPHPPASRQHEAWVEDKKNDGWIYGPVKDMAKKEHPCMVPYSELPVEQRLKDHLFRHVVLAFREASA